MGFNNDDYINEQNKKQYINPQESTYKVPFKYEEYAVDEQIMKKVIQSDVAALHNRVRDNELTYVELVKSFWNQILKMKNYNAVISLNPEVIKQAESMSYDEKHDVLYGIPVLVKDNINMVGLPATAGAAILKEYMADTDAELITRLKEKGALILGKTNLSEWANFMSTESSNGYSAMGGQTKNAFGHFDVGGSSAGSAVAVALNMSPVTIGTETSGSIIYPASQNGVVGLKPTLGLVSQEGIIPISKTHDTAGPMAGTVKDTYHLFKGMSSVEEEADWDIELNDFKAGILNNEGIKTVYREEDDDIVLSVNTMFKNAAADCVNVTVDDSAFDVDYLSILKYEFNEGVRDFFAGSGDHALTLEHIISFNDKDLDNTAPYNQELLKQSSENDSVRKEIEELIKSNQRITRDALNTAFKKVDVLITLSNYATVLYAASGYPAVTVPGYTRSSGEPVGVTLIGKSGQDIRLLEMAHALEKTLQLSSTAF